MTVNIFYKSRVFSLRIHFNLHLNIYAEDTFFDKEGRFGDLFEVDLGCTDNLILQGGQPPCEQRPRALNLRQGLRPVTVRSRPIAHILQLS